MGDTWSMFRRTDYGSDVQEIMETKECKILQMKTGSGEGVMRIYQVFEGIYLMYSDFHMEECISQFESLDCLFCIDYCREGRIRRRGSQFVRGRKAEDFHCQSHYEGCTYYYSG